MNQNCCRFLARSLACAAIFSLGLSSLHAQTVEWSGGAQATSNTWSTAGNWVGGVAPTGGVNVLVATGNFTPGGAGAVVDTMSLGAGTTVGSVTFDNSNGQYPSQLRMNANFNTGAANRNLNLNRDGSNVVFNVVNGANVFIAGNSSTNTGTQFNSLNLTLNYTGMGIINVDGSSALSIGGNAASLRGNGTTIAGVQKTGTGALTLVGTSSNYTGGFQLSGGTLWVGGTSNLTNAAQPGPFGTGALTIDGGTKLASTLTSATTTFRIFDNPVNFTGGTVTLGDTTNNNGMQFTTGLNGNTSASTVSGDTILNVLSTVTINRSLSGSGSLTKDGAGVLNLNLPASYAGATTLRGGQLQLGADNLPTNGNVIFDGGTLRVGNTGFTANGHATTITSNGGTFSIAGGQSVTWNGTVTGVGALTLSGGGILVLSGTNDYSGGTTVSAGTLKGSPGSGALSVATGATYDLNSADHTIGALSGGGNVTLGASTLTTSTSSSGSFDGIIAGTGGFTKAGTGTLTLTGANTYSGATTITGGILTGKVGSGDLSVSSGASFDLGGGDRAVGAFSGAGGVVLGANTLTTNSTANSSFSGAISGTGGLTKNGSGTLTLSGTNSYSGATTVHEGGLAVNGSLASPVTVFTGATLSGGGTFLSSVNIGGAHSPGNSPGTQTFSSLTYTTGASVNWELATNSTAGAGTNYDQIVVNGTLDFSAPTSLNLSFNGSGSTVDWSNSLWSSNQTWVIFASSTTNNFSNLTLNTTGLLDSLGNDFSTALPGASFNLSSFGSGVNLTYNIAAIPEPSTYALLAIGCGLIAAGAWRRRRAV